MNKCNCEGKQQQACIDNPDCRPSYCRELAEKASAPQQRVAYNSNGDAYLVNSSENWRPKE